MLDALKKKKKKENKKNESMGRVSTVKDYLINKSRIILI